MDRTAQVLLVDRLKESKLIVGQSALCNYVSTLKLDDLLDMQTCDASSKVDYVNEFNHFGIDLLFPKKPTKPTEHTSTPTVEHLVASCHAAFPSTSNHEQPSCSIAIVEPPETAVNMDFSKVVVSKLPEANKLEKHTPSAFQNNQFTKKHDPVVATAPIRNNRVTNTQFIENNQPQNKNTPAFGYSTDNNRFSSRSNHKRTREQEVPKPIIPAETSPSPIQIAKQQFISAADILTTNLSNNKGSFNENAPRKPITTNNSAGTAHVAKRSKFISPCIKKQDAEEIKTNKSNETPEEDTLLSKVLKDDRLKNIDAKMVETLMNEIISKTENITWDDIAGLELAKKILHKTIIMPALRPELFSGDRKPPKGLLLFGPPGTGKTLIGKCIAAQANATFFSISSSSLTSKWVGEGEKMVRALFAVARVLQPSVIFLDEIDSLLTQRTDGEVEASRRIKTEYLVQFDGCGTDSSDRILLIGATNRPHEIDSAALRRFQKKLYIPLPEYEARKGLLLRRLNNSNGVNYDMSMEEIEAIAVKTEGYSGSDMAGVIKEAAQGPLNELMELDEADFVNFDADKIRKVNIKDFENALLGITKSVSQDELGSYLKWDKEYGAKF